MSSVKPLQNDIPLIKPVAPPGQETKVDAILAMAEQHLGFIPDGLRLYSVSPPLLELFFNTIGYFREGTSLSPVLTTMIRYLVSSKAECSFCIDLNEAFLHDMGVDVDAARAARSDRSMAPVEDKERVLLSIATRAVTDPDSISPEDMAMAYRQGWTDQEIFEAVALACSNRTFNYLLRTFNVEKQGVFA